MIVADVNLIAYLTIQSEHSALAEAAYARDAAWAAPLLWSSEFRNTLVACVRDCAVTVESALLSLRLAEEIIGEREFAVVSENVLRLARETQCSAYDCEYAALAADLDVPLVTTDEQVLRAFPKTAVSLGRFARRRK